MERLRITAAGAKSKCIPFDATDDHGGKDIATLGLDFGTAFTKAVVRFRGRSQAVTWEKVAELRDIYLFPSCFSEHTSGQLVLGEEESADWTVHRGIKMALLEGGSLSKLSERAIDTAVIFVAVAVRHAQAWFRQNVAREGARSWRLHMGLPSRAAEGPLRDLFQHVAEQAIHAAECSGPLRRDRLRAGSCDTKDRVSVIPELAAQLQSYVMSNQRQDDLHALVDVGAGTVDIAYFLVHRQDDRPCIDILGWEVKKLGVHYFIAASVGQSGEGRSWTDLDAVLTDQQVSAKIGESEVCVSARRDGYRMKFEKAFEGAFLSSLEKYRRGPVNERRAPLRVFVCGGGSRLKQTDRIIARLEAQYRKLGRVSEFLVSPLPGASRDDLIYDGDSYDRMSVAHGLCERGPNLSRATFHHASENVRIEIREQEDRDATR